MSLSNIAFIQHQIIQKFLKFKNDSHILATSSCYMLQITVLVIKVLGKIISLPLLPVSYIVCHATNIKIQLAPLCCFNFYVQILMLLQNS